MKRLLLVLIVLLAFESGMQFDRWLHRPITAAGLTVPMPHTLAPVEAPPGVGVFPPNRWTCDTFAICYTQI